MVADGCYAGPKMRALVARTTSWTLCVAQALDRGTTLAWISRNRRLSRNYERQTRIATVFVKLAMIRIMLRRITVSGST